MKAFKYSDWALGKFISDIKKLSFYDRTIFVILGDHGFVSDEFDQNRSIELASYHIPCLIIAPNLESKINNRVASQTDIIPTDHDLLGGTFIHHSWGKNLFNSKPGNDFTIMIPAGMNHIVGMIQDETLLIYNFLDGSDFFHIKDFSNNINLKEIITIKAYHKEMEKKMFGYLKMASHTLNTYKCGIIFNQ